MVVRRGAGETGERCWLEEGDYCGLGAAALEMPMRGREIAGVGGVSLLRPDPLVTLKPVELVKQQVQKNHSSSPAPSPAELRLIQEFMHEVSPLEEGVDEVALKKLVKSNTFKKFVRRLELENEVVELHQQLEKEVELHSTLQSALAHASASSATELPESVVHDLPRNVQRLLTDIAMLEATVLRLETQASALQWDIVHVRTERESIELSLPVATPVKVFASPKQSPRLHAQESPKLTPLVTGVRVRASPKQASVSLPTVRTTPVSAASPAKKPRSPSLATLKELLHTSAPKPEAQFEFCTPIPKSPPSPPSPRQSLRSLWTTNDGAPPSSLPPILKKLNAKDRARVHESSSPDATTTCFPSMLHQQTPSPFTPGEAQRTTTPVTPASQQHQQPDASPTRRLLNPARLLVSTKRLAFWNFSSSSVDDVPSPSNRAANPTPEPELQRSDPPEQDDCSSILDEDFAEDARLHKLHRSQGMKRPDQSKRNSDASSSPRKSMKESPRKSMKESPRASSVDAWTTPQERPSHANRVSEEMVRCMVDIFCHLAEPSADGAHGGGHECPLSPSSHTGRLSTSSSLSSSHSDSSLPLGARSPDLNPGLYGGVMAMAGGEAAAAGDPYKAMGKLPWSDLGPYADAFEVPWLSVGKNQLEYVAHSLGKFRLLVERLAKVDPSAMTHEEKLAFWINLYNALLMHAFLAYGIPRSDLKFFALMQKAAYCVGGHWFNAATIECNLLKAKIMLHRPQFALIMALHNKKLTEEQSQYGIAKAEPTVNFALSCGGHSSPMVRVYTPEHIHDELDSAFQDYLRATVGMTAKSRVLLPKLVYNYAREFVDDEAVLEWVCRFLPIAQVTVIYECVQQRQRRRLWNPPSAPFSVAPYSFAFRYLFPKSICGGGTGGGGTVPGPPLVGGDDYEKKRFLFCT